MNILSFKRTEVVAMVSKGMSRQEKIRYWDICKALSEGKTIETVADDFGYSSRQVDYIKAHNCKSCKAQ